MKNPNFLKTTELSKERAQDQTYFRNRALLKLEQKKFMILLSLITLHLRPIATQSP